MKSLEETVSEKPKEFKLCREIIKSFLIPGYSFISLHKAIKQDREKFKLSLGDRVFQYIDGLEMTLPLEIIKTIVYFSAASILYDKLKDSF